MATPYSPTARLAQPTAPALPQGDPANLALVRELLDNRALALALLRGSGGPDVRVTVGGSAGAPSLDVSDAEPVAVRDEDLVWRAAGPTAGTVTPGALAASTIHYLYLRSATDGSISYVVSTTGPTTGLYRATGDELQRLVGAFATGLLGFPLPAVVSARSGRYITSSGRAELTVLDNGRATTWATVSLAALVPPWATTAWVYCRVYKAAANTGVRELRVRRSSADGGYLVAASVLSADAGGAPADTNVEQLVQVPLLNQAFEYNLSAAVTNSDPYGARFIVAGWE